ncbi:MAG: hypothetical protein AAB134_02290 [Pseudomonadota bacterium]
MKHEFERILPAFWACINCGKAISRETPSQFALDEECPKAPLDPAPARVEKARLQELARAAAAKRDRRLPRRHKP